MSGEESLYPLLQVGQIFWRSYVETRHSTYQQLIYVWPFKRYFKVLRVWRL